MIRYRKLPGAVLRAILCRARDRRVRGRGRRGRIAKLADPARTAADLRAGKIDVIVGGPLRVLLTHASDPASDLICFCDVVARDPFFVIGRERRPDFRRAIWRCAFRVRFRSAHAVVVPSDDIPPRRTRSRVVEPDRRTLDGRERGGAARGALDAAQVFQPYAESLLTDGGCYLWYAAADRGLTAYTTLVTRRSVAGRAPGPNSLRWCVRLPVVAAFLSEKPSLDVAEALRDFFPDIPSKLRRRQSPAHRALGLYGPDPSRGSGLDRLQAAMRSGGALDPRHAVRSVVDNSPRKKAVKAFAVLSVQLLPVRNSAPARGSVPRPIRS